MLWPGTLRIMESILRMNKIITANIQEYRLYPLIVRMDAIKLNSSVSQQLLMGFINQELVNRIILPQDHCHVKHLHISVRHYW